MKISFNTVSYSKPANFKGLWGKTTKYTDYDRVLNVPKVRETKYYYPFSDESDDDINDIVKNNSLAVVDTSYGTTRYLLNRCKVCYTLPFTENEFGEFRDGTISDQKTSDMIKHYACGKYLTSEYGTDQVPAVKTSGKVALVS